MRRPRGGFERRGDANGQAVKPCTRPALHRHRRHAIEALRSGASTPTSGTAERRGGRPGRRLPCMHGHLAHRRPFPRATPLRRPSTASGCAHQRGSRRRKTPQAAQRARTPKTAAIRLSSPLFEIRVDSSSDFALHEAIERRISAANAAGRPLAPTCRSVALPGSAGRESHDTGPRVSLHGTPARTSLRLHPGRAHCLSTVVRRW